MSISVILTGGPPDPIVAVVSGQRFLCIYDWSKPYGPIYRCGKCLIGRVAHGEVILRPNCARCGALIHRNGDVDASSSL